MKNLLQTLRAPFGALCLLGLLLCADTAHAQTSVMIWPLDPVIEDDQRASALWLENRGTRPVSLQVRVLAWTQDGQEENYANQDSVQPSPPVATIAPGQRQMVRLMKTQGPADGVEAAYRILVDELPPVENATGMESNNDASAMGIKLQIRYSVPLFVSGKNHWTKPRQDRRREASSATPPNLQWRSERVGEEHFLVVRNRGAAHARLTAVQWIRAGQPNQVINAGLLGYALAHSQMRWRLNAPPPAGFGLQAKVNANDQAEEIKPQ